MRTHAHSSCVYVCSHMCRYRHMSGCAMHICDMHVGAQHYCWESFWFILHLIHLGNEAISLSRVRTSQTAGLASQFASGFPSLCPLSSGITGKPPHQPGICMSSEDLNCPSTCTVRALSIEPAPEPHPLISLLWKTKQLHVSRQAAS